MGAKDNQYHEKKKSPAQHVQAKNFRFKSEI